MKKFLRFWYPPIIWAFVVFSFSAQTTPSTSSVHWQDFSIKKLAHVTEYAILTVLVYRALINYKVEKMKAMLIALLFSMFYASTDEIHQIFTPGREPHIRDVIIDTIGSGLSLLFIWKLLPKAPKRLRMLAKDFQLL